VFPEEPNDPAPAHPVSVRQATASKAIAARNFRLMPSSFP
jgi:hypothetical protein